MAQRRTVITRVDPAFISFGEKIMRERLTKGLAKMSKKDLGMPEFTRLLLRTDSIKFAEQELKTKPKRENLF